MDHNTINGKWRMFIDAFFPGDTIPAIHHDEMQKAFFGGAAAVINIMIGMAEDDISEAAGAEMLESLRKECVDFRRSIKK